MNSFNKIERKKYTPEIEDVIALQEYIIFTDELRDLKFIVFKFYNRVSYELNSIEFEVYSYDKDNFLIAKKTVSIDDLNVAPTQMFTPNAKLRVESKTEVISVKVIKAEFSCVTYLDGQFVNKDYSYDKYKTEADLKNDQALKDLAISNSKAEKEKKDKELKEIKELIKYNTQINKQMSKLDETINTLEVKKNYRKTSMFNKNKSGGLLKFFLVLIILLTIVGSVAVQFINKTTLSRYTDKDLDYVIVNPQSITVNNKAYDGEAYISKAYVTSNTVVMPSSSTKKGFTLLDETLLAYIPGVHTDEASYSVKGVYTSAFEGTIIQEVKFESDYVIMDSAFKNCTNLYTVYNADYITYVGDNAFLGSKISFFTSSRTTFIGANAFANCSNLTTFKAPSAKVSKGVFKNTPKLISASFSAVDSTVKSVGDLFGVKNSDLKQNITITFNSKVSESFYYDLPKNVKIVNPNFDDSMRTRPVKK